MLSASTSPLSPSLSPPLLSSPLPLTPSPRHLSPHLPLPLLPITSLSSPSPPSPLHHLPLLCLQERDGFNGLMSRRGRGDGGGSGASSDLQEITYAVPADKCGLVIGKGERGAPGVERLSGGMLLVIDGY